MELVNNCNINQIEFLIEKLFIRLAKCIADPHMPITDKAMEFFSHEPILNILKNYKDKVFPILVPVINYGITNHWNKEMRESFKLFSAVLKEISTDMYLENVCYYERHKTLGYLIMSIDAVKEERDRVDKKWEALEKVARDINVLLKYQIPYQDGHIIGDYNGLDNGAITVVE